MQEILTEIKKDDTKQYQDKRGIMTYEGYIEFEKEEWILMIHEGDGCFTNFFEGEKLKTAKEVKKRISEISEDMGWYEVQYKTENDDLMVTIFYDTVE